MTRSRHHFVGETRLSELLDDSVTRAVMRSDRIHREEMLDAIRHAQLILRWRGLAAKPPLNVTDSASNV